MCNGNARATIGEVISLTLKLQQVDSKSHVWVLDVKLGDGRIVTTPRAKVEIIEE